MHTCIARTETPPVPCTSTTSPSLTPVKPRNPNKAFQAVNPAHSNVLASTNDNPSGMRTRAVSWKIPYVHNAPSVPWPRPVKISGKVAGSAYGFLGRRCVHTLSPGLKVFTFAPVAWIVPEPSEVGITGFSRERPSNAYGREQFC